MHYTEIAPPEKLSSFVKCFWEYKSTDEDIHHTILPNGCFELVMVFEQQGPTTLFLSGLRTKPYDVHIPKGVTVSAIRFMLLSSEYIFGKEIGSILDATLLLESNFWGLKELVSLPFKDRATAIGKKLSEITSEKEIDRERQLLMTTVYTPDLSVEEVVKTTCWEGRRINRYFNKQFGLSLKTFLNIIRLRSSFESIKEGTLYPDLNYYDQSHYIKETRKYTGESPKKLLKNEDDRFLQFSVNRKD